MDFSNKIIPLNNENRKSFNIKKLFESHGPWTIDNHRLDELTSIDILLNSSASVTEETSTGKTTANTGSMIGRAAAGGVLLGGVGAVVGGITGAKTTVNTSTSIESLETKLTCKLTFADGKILHAIITDPAAYHWLLAFTTSRKFTEEEIEEEKLIANNNKIRLNKEQHAKDILGEFKFKGISEFPVIFLVCALAGIVYISIFGLSFFKFVGLIIALIFTGGTASIFIERKNSSDMKSAKIDYEKKLKELTKNI